MSDSSDVVKAGEHQRDRWTSRWAFYFAAIGAAVGFGNVWRYVVCIASSPLLGPETKLIRDFGHGKKHSRNFLVVSLDSGSQHWRQTMGAAPFSSPTSLHFS